MANRLPRGFTLVELLVSLTLLAGLLAALLFTLHRSRQEADRIVRLVEHRQDARATLQLLEREIRMAGSGWGRLAVEASDNGTPVQFYGIMPGFAPGGNDSLRLLGAWSAATALTESMPFPNSNLRVATTAGFANGDLAVVTDGAHAHLFQVTQVLSGSFLLEHGPSSTWNAPGGHAHWPTGGYGIGARCYRADLVSYRVEGGGTPQLVRQTFQGPAQLVTADIDRFQIWYRMQDSTLTRDPGALGPGVSLIDKIAPRIGIRVTDRWRPTVVDSVSAEIAPRTFE